MSARSDQLCGCLQSLDQRVSDDDADADDAAADARERHQGHNKIRAGERKSQMTI